MSAGQSRASIVSLSSIAPPPRRGARPSAAPVMMPPRAAPSTHPPLVRRMDLANFIAPAEVDPAEAGEAAESEGGDEGGKGKGRE